LTVAVAGASLAGRRSPQSFRSQAGAGRGGDVEQPPPLGRAADAAQRVKRGPLGTGHELYGYAMDHSMRIRLGDYLIRKQSLVII
jgi:hypothetical protein